MDASTKAAPGPARIFRGTARARTASVRLPFFPLARRGDGPDYDRVLQD